MIHLGSTNHRIARLYIYFWEIASTITSAGPSLARKTDIRTKNENVCVVKMCFVSWGSLVRLHERKKAKKQTN